MKYLLDVTKPSPEQQHSEQLNIPPFLLQWSLSSRCPKKEELSAARG